MARPSRIPSFRKTPWVWSRGDGRGYCADPYITPHGEQLTEDDYEQAAAQEMPQSIKIWKNLSHAH
eukprot:1354027-Pyramimonas_sp.AAC.1